jgi:hypothetical protein
MHDLVVRGLEQASKRPGTFPLRVDAPDDASQHPRAERPLRRSLPPVEVSACDHEARGRALERAARTPVTVTELEA